MMPSPTRQPNDGSKKSQSADPNPPTLAAFSPVPQPGASPATKQRSAIIVHHKSPLLVATPPAITRALAFSHPFLLPISQAVGLITWTSGEPWESFLLVASFWAITLYGDIAIRYAGPIIVVAILILGMYSRRYSPLSSSGWTGEKLPGQKKENLEGGMKHQKSLDEIVETLNVFTARCNILLEPFMQLTDFLSTQRTATSATTRPALTSLFIRILFVTPIWVGLTFPPVYLLTSRRVITAIGTIMLSWHSRPARVTRALLWRSRLVRKISSFITGLDFASVEPSDKATKQPKPPLPPRQKDQRDIASSLATTGKASSAGVRFTFVVFENQRRWLGLGWTYSLLAYERAPWTDEHLNPADPKDSFRLPEVENGSARWRWVEGGDWEVDAGGKGKTSQGSEGWIYYDNKWNDGRRGQDGWGRYTRRRKWYRDAELVEVESDLGMDGSTATLKALAPSGKPSESSKHSKDSSIDSNEPNSAPTRRRGFFRRSSNRSVSSNGDFSVSSTLRNDEDDTHVVPPHHERNSDWGVEDDVKMGLG